MKRLAVALALSFFAVATGHSVTHAQNVVAATAPSQAVSATPSERPSTNPADLDLEQLANMDVKVTSASKKEESLWGAPAAIFVISSEEIRRSGASSIPEVLRAVPGLTVQHVNSHSWSVSARGFNGFPNEKMLVLIDGRAVYDPLYGGVYWDEQEDVRLEDVNRIEVIRGPGGALWGANAVNGVINVTTKSAKQTQGVSVSTSLGRDEGYQGSLRVGGRAGKNFYYRLYGKSSYWDPFVSTSGAEMFNAWNGSSGGFRADWEATDADSLTVDGGVLVGHVEDAGLVVDYASSGRVNNRFDIRTGHIQTQWEHTFSDQSKTGVSAYCAWRDRTDIEYGGEFRNSCNVDLQHNYTINPRNSIVWGGGFRSTADQTRVTFRNHFAPADRRLNFFSAFGQYELAVVPDRLRIIGGSKFEHNTYTGFEVQPQVRAVWTAAKSHNIWGSVSRSVRTPTRNEHDNYLTFLRIPQGAPPTPPLISAFIGNPNVEAEHQKAYELGYRYQYSTVFTFDVAAFYSSYTGLLRPDFGSAVTSFHPDPPYFLSAYRFNNLARSQTHGLELSAKFRPVHAWEMSVGVTENRGTTPAMNATSRHQFNVQSRLDLPHQFELDSALYYVNGFSVLGIAPVLVPTTNRLDTGLTWHTIHGFSFGVWGRNLQSGHHMEGSGNYLSTGEVRRAVVFKMTWDFNPEKIEPKHP